MLTRVYLLFLHNIIFIPFEVSGTSMFEVKPLRNAGYEMRLEENNVTRTLQWFPGDEPWLNVYVRMCGYLCVANKRVRVSWTDPHYPLCRGLCFSCRCEHTCSMYGTCCPTLSMPNGMMVNPNGLLASIGLYYEDSNEDSIKINPKTLSALSFSDSNDFYRFSKVASTRGLPVLMLGKFRCLPTSYDGSKILYSVHAIAECPDTETNTTLRHLCEKRDVVDETTTTPFSDFSSGVVFKNIYCLRCWGKVLKLKNVGDGEEESASFRQRFKKWNISVECLVYQRLYSVVSLDAFLANVYKSISLKNGNQQVTNPRCRIQYHAPESEHPTSQCDDTHYRHSVGDEEGFTAPHSRQVQCSDSGNEEMRNVFIDYCNSIKSEAYQFHKRQNIFCYMCSRAAEWPSCRDVSTNTNNTKPTFRAPTRLLTGPPPHLIHHETHRSNRVSGVDPEYRCPHALEWLDYEKDVCRLPSCAAGKVLSHALSECQAAISVIEGLGYKLSVVLVPDQLLSVRHAQLVNEEVIAFFNRFVDEGYLAVYMAIVGHASLDELDVIRYVKIQGNLLARTAKGRDEFEKEVLQYTFQVVIGGSPTSGNNNITVSLLTEAFGVDFVGRMGIREYTQGNPEDQFHLPTSRKLMTESQNMTLSAASLDKIKTVLYVEIGEPDHYHPSWEMKNDFIDMNPSLICPFVAFELKELSHINDVTFLVHFFYKGKIRTLNTTALGGGMAIEGGQLRICIDAFREEFPGFELTNDTTNATEFNVPWMSRVKRHMTITCIILSTLCLLATSFTYCAFSHLRTLSGLNTLSLCLTLASAQLCLILVVELVGYVHGEVCIALGIALHYTWLCSFSWMCVSCGHLYTVFNDTAAGIGPKDPNRKHSQYCVSTFGTSAVLVSLHICCSEILSDGASTGYSDTICFLDVYWSRLTVIVSFIIPLVVVVVVNAAMFAQTLRDSGLVRDLQDNIKLKSRREMATYAKLSTLTGVQWLVTILAFWMDNDIADLASALLVGIEGVFIFVSFTCNAKTRKLYRDSFGKPVNTRPSSCTNILAIQSTSV